MNTALFTEDEVLIIYNNLLDEYVKYYLQKDIRDYEKKHKFYFNFEGYDLEDIASELRVTLITAVGQYKRKKKSSSWVIRKKEPPVINNPKNYMLKVVKKRLYSYLNVLGNERKAEKKYQGEIEMKLVEERDRKQLFLYTYLSKNDTLAVDFIDICKNNLNIVEKTILFNVLTGDSYESIGKLLKKTPDYVRKLYKAVAKKLINELEVIEIDEWKKRNPAFPIKKKKKVKK